jgi:DNA-binding phage protein
METTMIKNKMNHKKLEKLLINPSKKAIKFAKWMERSELYSEHSFLIALLLLDAIEKSDDNTDQVMEKLGVSKKRLVKILKGRANLKLSEIVRIEQEYRFSILIKPQY